MDKEYRNLLRHAETEIDFIRIERIQTRKGLRTQITLINNNRKEYDGTWTETRTKARTRAWTGTMTRIGARTGVMIGTRTMIMTTTMTLIMTGTRTGIGTRVGT